MRNAQKKDEKIQAIIEVVKEKPYENYVIHNGLLCKNVNGNIIIVVPEMMENGIIRKMHEDGHFKTKKVQEMIEREFFIFSIKNKIEQIIQNCVHCILSERKNGKQEGYLHPIYKADVPLDKWHVDHLGPLQSTNKNYNHVLAIIDSFTKFIWIFPTKSTTANETVNKLKLITDIFGNPRRIISDRGTAFTANEFKRFCEEEKIDLVQITTGVPRGNGQIERMNRIIIPVLAKLSIDEPDKWYKHVATVQKCLNKTYQRSIDTSPCELMFGTKMKTQSDMNILKIIEQEVAEQFDDERNDLRSKAKQQIEKIQEENRRTFNAKRKKPTEYNVNDLVSIKKTLE